MRISRAELYKRVSEAPLNKVAPGFGISGTALAALCKKHDVPDPGSGHWVRLSMGLPTELPTLPEHADPESDVINIEPSKARARTSSETQMEAMSEPGATQPKTSAEISVSNRLTKPHPIIADWISDHERRRKEALSSRNPWIREHSPAPYSALDNRKHRIYDALFKALEARGAKVAKADKGLLCVIIDGEKIEFQIRERNRQVKVPPEDRRSSYLSQELVGTGRLVFAIRTYLRGRHNEEYLEADKKPLEDMLPQIVERLFEGASILKAWHIEQAQEQERRRQLEAQRIEKHRLAKQEEKRRQRFSELAHDWQTAQLLRQFVETLEARSYDPTTMIGEKRLDEWVAWAGTCVQALDPTLGGAEGVFAAIENVKVERDWSY